MTEHWSRQYARHVAAQLGISISALAVKSGIATTTLTRALNNKDHKHNLGRATLDKIEAATGVSYAPFKECSSEEPPQTIGQAEFESRLARLSPSRRRSVLQYLADQEALHAQEIFEPGGDDHSEGK